MSYNGDTKHMSVDNSKLLQNEINQTLLRVQ